MGNRGERGLALASPHINMSKISQEVDKYGMKTALARKKAESEGMIIIEGDCTLLTLDIDSPDSLLCFKAMIGVVAEMFGVVKYSKWKSKSGKKHHITVEMKEPLSISTRCVLHLVLGSDPIRELLAQKDIEKDEPYPHMLFQPSNAVITTVEMK